MYIIMTLNCMPAGRQSYILRMRIYASSLRTYVLRLYIAMVLLHMIIYKRILVVESEWAPLVFIQYILVAMNMMP